MGLGDFFKNIFGKKNCALCGKECGMMHRSKIKNKESFALIVEIMFKIHSLKRTHIR